MLEVGVYDEMDDMNDEIILPLSNVLKCNTVSSNLLSVSKVVDELGLEVVFRSDCVQFLQEDLLDYSKAVVFEAGLRRKQADGGHLQA